MQAIACRIDSSEAIASDELGFFFVIPPYHAKSPMHRGIGPSDYSEVLPFSTINLYDIV